MIDKVFKLKENKTTVSKELIAGLTTFIAMSYIIFVNPQVLSQTGMDYEAVYGATILTTIIATLILALYANVPYASSAGIGLGSLFTYTMCASLGYTWKQALAIVCICGLLNLLITITSLRKKILKAIPEFLQESITVGIGLFITYVGLINGNILEFASDSNVNGIALNVVPKLSNITTPNALVAVLGLIFTSILLVRKSKGAYLKGILFATLIGIPLGVTHAPDFTNYNIFPDITPTLFQVDFVGLFTAKTGLIVTLMTIFSVTMSDLFDTLGIFIGTGKKAGIFKMTKDGEMPKRLERAMIADSAGSVFGAFIGTSSVTTYLESSAGIEAGGRTGLTSIFVCLFFLLSLFIYPIIACVPMVAVAPILILIGVSMFGSIVKINWSNMQEAIPAFFCIIMMGFAYSITTGIEFGFIFYSLISIYTNNANFVSPIIYIFSVLFIIKYILMTL